MRRFRDILKRFCVMTAIFVTMVVVGGCIKDDTEGPSSDGAYTVVLTTRAGGDIEHDAQYPGEDAYNENAINRVMLFFYPDNAGEPDADDTAAIYSEVIEDVNTSHRVSLSIKADLREKLFGQIKGSARVFAVVNLPKSDKNGSASGAPSIKANATVNEIKSTVVETDFRIVGGTLPEFVMLGEGIIKFSDNLKSASGTIPVTRTASKIRIALQITEPMDDYDPTNPDKVLRRWTADPKDIRVYITNGVSKAHIGGVPFPREELSAGDYYKISPSPEDNEESDYNTRARTLEESNIEKYPYWNAVPLYSYPHSWENTPYEDRQTYLVIQVPWKSDTEGIEYTNCYYQVPINLRGGTGSDSDGNPLEIEENTLKSNMYYLVKLNIGMLGSFNPEEPLEIQASYYVVPWQDEVLDAKLADNRYLVVDQTNWVINNEDDLDIPFHTSHKTMIARVKYRFWEFNPIGKLGQSANGNPGVYTDDGETITIDYDGKPLRRTFLWEDPRIPKADNSIINTTISKNNGDSIWRVKIDNDNFIVSYNHAMDRWIEKTSSGADVFGEVVKGRNNVKITGYYGRCNGETAYLEKSNMKNWSKIEVEITIIHEDLLYKIDDTRFMQTIYITQYPQMYIEAERSNVDSKGDSYFGSTGFLYVNGNRSEKGQNNIWNHVVGTIQGPDGEGSSNQNLNMYVVSISQLNDPDYIIGDPRLLTVNNNLSDGSFTYYTDTNPSSSDNPSNPWTENTYDYYFQSDESTEWGNRTVARINAGNRTTINAPVKGGTSVDEIPVVGNLSNYYPTDESSTKENYVAPKLRIASSFGGIGGLVNKTVARRRCAAYQEAGRPAGRWRLPTKAEIKFINELSTEGCIPMLFSRWGAQAIYAGEPSTHNNGTAYRNFPNYWCASGAVHIHYNTGELEYLYESELERRRAYLGQEWQGGIWGSWVDIYETRDNEGPNDATKDGYSAQVAVRCVYDEWYWIDVDGNPDLCDLKEFTWGDKPKASPQE